jgi:hypothetical protein
VVVNFCNDDTKNRLEIMVICQEVVEFSKALPSLIIRFTGVMLITWLIYVLNKLVLIGKDVCGYIIT